MGLVVRLYSSVSSPINSSEERSEWLLASRTASQSVLHSVSWYFFMTRVSFSQLHSSIRLKYFEMMMRGQKWIQLQYEVRHHTYLCNIPISFVASWFCIDKSLWYFPNLCLIQRFSMLVEGFRQLHTINVWNKNKKNDAFSLQTLLFPISSGFYFRVIISWACWSYPELCTTNVKPQLKRGNYLPAELQ